MSIKNKQVPSEIEKYTSPKNVQEVRLGDYIIMDGFPCRVTNIVQKIEYKFCARKVIIDGINLFKNQKQQELFILSSFLLVPNHVQIQEYDLLQISDNGEVIVLLQNGEVKEDLKLDQSQQPMIDQIKDAIENEKEVTITVVSTMEKEIIVSYKIIN